ncbi:stalk domain-containing protein [Sedimentibacter sp.]|uniref:stalk domain-containing protein n=1 Tax=Sedimentibacter sp. TaxID=1960295 RepID=UPI00289C850F|nr:stalk domain-containing protein [Sedimentibacter sp.]
MKKIKTFTTYVLVLLLMLSSLMVFPGYAYGSSAVEKFSFKTLEGYYLCAEDGGGNILTADRTEVGPWEKFEIVNISKGYVAVKSDEGYYLSASDDEESLHVEATEVGKRQKFKLVELDNKKVALKTYYDKYVCAENGGGGKVVADRTKIGEWESFELIKSKESNDEEKSTLTAKVSDKEVKLTWTKVESTKKVVGYNLYRGTVSGKQSKTPITDALIEGTSYTDKNIKADTKYYYIVKPVYKDKTIGPASNEVEVILKSSIVLSAKSASNGVELSWNKPKYSPEIIGYNIYRGTQSGKQSDTPITDFLIEGTSYTDKNIKADTKYYYIVKPVYKDKTIGPASNEVEVILKSSIVLSAKSASNGVELSWNKPKYSPEIIGYNIYRGTQSGKQSDTPITDFPIEKTSYTDKNIKADTKYYYVVNPVYKDKTLGPASNEVEATMKSTITLSAKSVSNGIELSWNKPKYSNEIVGYNIYRATRSGTQSKTPITDFPIEGTSYTDKNIENNQTYYYILKVVYKDKTLGEPTAEVSVKSNFGKTIVLQVGSKYMHVNGKKIEIDPGKGTEVVIKNGRTFLPIRALIENMGGEVEWDQWERKVSLYLDKHKIHLWIGNKTAKVDGVNKETDVEPYISDSNRTMLPLRFIIENFDCEVDWDGTTKKVTIRTN